MKTITACFLLFLLFPASSVFCAETDSPSRPLSDCFPADTYLYLECPGVRDLAERAKSTGLYSLWTDPSMSALRAYCGSPDSDSSLQSTDSALPAFLALQQSMSGGVALGLIGSPSVPQWLVVADVGSAEPQARALLDSVYSYESSRGFPPRPSEMSGTPVTSSSLDDECSAIFQGLLLFGSRDALASSLYMLHADAPSLSLTSSVDFTKSMSFLSGRPSYRAFLDPQVLLRDVRSAVPPSAPLDPAPLLDAFGLGDVETFSLEGSFVLSGVLERVRISTSSASSPLIEMSGRSPVDESRMRLIPRSALLCSARSVDPRSSYSLWRKFSDAAESASPDFSLFPPSPFPAVDLRNALASLESASGVSIEKDVIANLGSSSISYLTVPEGENPLGMLTGMQQVFLLEAANEEPLSRALSSLADAAQRNPSLLGPPGLAPDDLPFKVQTSSLGTIKVVYLDYASPTLSPSLAVYGGYLIYANNTDSLKKAIDNIIAPSPSITDSEEFRRARSALSKSPSQIAYLSLDRLIDLAYQYIMPSILSGVDAAQARGDASFSSADVPPAYVPKRHLDGVCLCISASGNLLDSEVYSPTGFAPLLFAALFSAASRPALARLEAAVAPPQSTDPPRARLIEMGRRLQLSTILRAEKFPDRLSDVVGPEFLQAPQDPSPESPTDYVYVPGLTMSSPGRKVLVYERSGLNPDGRHVLRVDGSVEFLTEQDFQSLIQEQTK